MGPVITAYFMSKWTREDLHKIAALAKLTFSDEEIEIRLKEFQDILGHIDVLGDAPKEKSPQAHNKSLRMVDDEPQPSMAIEDVLANAPQPQPPFFTIPKVIKGGKSK